MNHDCLHSQANCLHKKNEFSWGGTERKGKKNQRQKARKENLSSIAFMKDIYYKQLVSENQLLILCINEENKSPGWFCRNQLKDKLYSVKE